MPGPPGDHPDAQRILGVRAAEAILDEQLFAVQELERGPPPDGLVLSLSEDCMGKLVTSLRQRNVVILGSNQKEGASEWRKDRPDEPRQISRVTSPSGERSTSLQRL